MIIQTVPTTKEHCESSPHSSVDTQKNPENALGRGTTTIEKVTITTSESTWAGSTDEKQLVRKVDMRIMPLTCLLYLFACKFLCTVSAPIGLLLTWTQSLTGLILGTRDYKVFQRMHWMETQPVHYLTGWLRRFSSHMCVLCFAFYSFSFSETYHDQILCQIPATITSKLFPPRIWLGCAVIGWGLSSTLMVSLRLSFFPFNRDCDVVEHAGIVVNCVQLSGYSGLSNLRGHIRSGFWPRSSSILL